MSTKTLIFVYNANSGGWSALADWVHKTLRPSTYPCELCEMTYGILGMRRVWAEFIRQGGFEALFTYKDLVSQDYPELPTGALPAIYLKDAQQVREVVSSKDFSRLGSVESLIKLLEVELGK